MKIIFNIKYRQLLEFIVESMIRISGYSAVLFVFLIFVFLMQESLPTFVDVRVGDLWNQRWYPIENYFGILPLLSGSLIITLGAAIVSIPLGIMTAIFIAEIAPRWLREILKPLVEILGGVPSVVLGFLGITVLAPIVREELYLPTGLTAFTGAILLAGMAIPTIVSVAEDALDAVPKEYKDAALAIGATRWQTIWRVTLPAARSGVLTAIMLGIGRAIGETMTVMMVTGNAPQMASGIGSLFVSLRTMTATIAAEMGEVANGSLHYHVLFSIGLVLFIISFIVNISASAVLFRSRKRTERLLS
ncbi:MAG TPA: phosphate ABC transporter permease subunit PstC [Chloroflexi bacterium]|nr:phosphate ABC transporter permease subunit PstC [Chloroflexota bacterium]